MNPPPAVRTSENTERAMKSDLRIFTRWCDERGAAPLPAKAETVAAFVDAMAERRAPATVRRYVTSITSAHRAIGMDKTLKSPPVRRALERMYRRKGRRQAHAHALTSSLRRRMLEASGERLIDVRNAALLAVAYDTMLRRTDLVSLQVSDLSVAPKGDATFVVRHRANDDEGGGESVWIAPDTAHLVRAWLVGAAIADGLVFRSIRTGGTLGERLHPSQVPRIFKAMARKAGLPEAEIKGLSADSARIGAARDMLAAGIELPTILEAGRWKTSAMLERYREPQPAGPGGAALLARLQKRA